jgi:3-oxoacyl-[acyl-carrier-protein] synthase II
VDDADVMVAGGAEGAICRSASPASAPAARCPPASTTRPKGSRPYDKDRDGFVMGEGAGVVVLEEYEHAKARGAKIYAEVVGYGMSGDAYHITAPAEDGDGGFRAMQMALKRAGSSPRTSTTSTPTAPRRRWRRDRARRGRAAVRQRGGKMSMSSTKSSIGHLLGAAGAVEAIFSHPRDARRHRAADHQSRQSRKGGHDEFFWI